MTHTLKTDPVPFSQVWQGRKTFEVRKDDRPYEVGDFLELKETLYSGLEMQNGAPLIYTGNAVYVKVTYLLRDSYGVRPGFVILAFPPATV